MLEQLRDLLFILLSIAGLVYIWKIIFVSLLKNKNDKFIYVVVPISDTVENVEQLVRSAAERTIFMGNNKWDRVVCVDYGASKEQQDIVKNLCDEYSFLDYMDNKTFRNVFENENIFKNEKEHTA